MPSDAPKSHSSANTSICSAEHEKHMRTIDSEGQTHHSHRKHSSQGNTSAARSYQPDTDSQILDSVLSILETTLSHSHTDFQGETRSNPKRCHSAMAATTEGQTGGYFIDQYGHFRQGKYDSTRSQSASKAGHRGKHSLDQLRLSVGPDDGPVKQKTGSLVPSVALKGIPNQPPKFRHFLKAHHAVPDDLHIKKLQSKILRSGSAALDGQAAFSSTKSRATYEPSSARVRPVSAQLSVLSVSAEHKEPFEQPLPGCYAVKPVTKSPSKRRAHPVKPIPLPQASNKPAKTMDSTFRSTSSSSVVAHGSRSSSMLKDEASFNADEVSGVPPVSNTDSSKIAQKGISLVKPVDPTANIALRAKIGKHGDSLNVGRYENEDCFTNISSATPLNGARASLSDASFLDVDVQIAEPHTHNAHSKHKSVAAKISHSGILDSPQNEIFLLKPRTAMPQPIAQKGKTGTDTEPTNFHFITRKESVDTEKISPLREEFISLGMRLAQLANRRAYIESTIANFEKYATDANADHTYLHSEMDSEQQKLDAIEEELSNILARRAELRQCFLNEGLDLQVDTKDERKARKSRIDRALLLELNALNTNQPLEYSVFSLAMNSTWIDPQQGMQMEDMGDKGQSMRPQSDALDGLGQSMVSPAKIPPRSNVLPRDMVATEAKPKKTQKDASNGEGGEDVRSESTEIGLQITDTIVVQQLSADATMEHVSQLLQHVEQVEQKPSFTALISALIMSFEDPNSMSTYRKKNIDAYAGIVQRLYTTEDSNAVIHSILPEAAHPYADQIVAFLNGLRLLLSTHQVAGFLGAIITIRRSFGLEWMLSPMPRFLASILSVVCSSLTSPAPDTAELDLLSFDAVKSGCTWLLSELLAELHNIATNQAAAIKFEDIHAAIQPVLRFLPVVGQDTSRRWQTKLHTLTTLSPQLLRFTDLRDILKE